MRKIVLTYGLIAGAVLSVLMALTVPFLDQIGSDNGALIGYTSMVLAFLMIYFGIRSYRDNVAGGTLSFGRAFQVGFLIMLIGVACYVATWEVIYYRFTPDFADKYAAHAIAQAKAAGRSPAEIAAVTKSMTTFAEQYHNPLINIAYTSLEPLPPGLLLTLLSAGLLSRKRRVSVAAAA